MRYKLSYFKDVADDISVAKKWYNEQLPGLEKRFSKDIKKAITRLKSTPFIHAVRYRQIRIAHPEVFPFGIHYYVDEGKKRIVIIGIIHNSRNSELLNKRVD